METIRYTKEEQSKVVDRLSKGDVIAFPTDTVFGIGCVFDDEDALRRLKEAKIRPDEKPIPMMVSSLKQIEQVAIVNEKAKKLIKALMPGAFTIVVNKKEDIPSYVTNGLNTIAIRMPDDAFVLSLMNDLNKPMLVSSANISAQKSCKSSDDVLEQLDGRMNGIVIGEAKSEIASTIVDVTGNDIKILREGILKEEMIFKILEED